MAGMSKRLHLGDIHFDIENELINITSDSKIVDQISYHDISKSDWGYVYEKYVGQILRERGYIVEYNGLSKGFNDDGVDLIAQKDNKDFLIQCKFIKKSTIGKQKIEQILYKASSMIASYCKRGKPTFCLVIPSISQSFGKKYKKAK